MGSIMFVKLPELRMNQFKSYAAYVSDGISAANHYVDGNRHAFTMWQVDPDVPGLTSYKVLVSENYYQQFLFFLDYYGLSFYSPAHRQFIVRI